MNVQFRVLLINPFRPSGVPPLQALKAMLVSWIASIGHAIIHSMMVDPTTPGKIMAFIANFDNYLAAQETPPTPQTGSAPVIPLGSATQAGPPP